LEWSWSSLILHPSSFIPHPSSLIPHSPRGIPNSHPFLNTTADSFLGTFHPHPHPHPHPRVGN
jgi:hypothetical protein